jgi:hypothetical protein
MMQVCKEVCYEFCCGCRDALPTKFIVTKEYNMLCFIHVFAMSMNLLYDCFFYTFIPFFIWFWGWTLPFEWILVSFLNIMYWKHFILQQPSFLALIVNNVVFRLLLLPGLWLQEQCLSYWMYPIYTSLLYAFYLFEYKHQTMTLQNQLQHFETHWIYFLGFGFPLFVLVHLLPFRASLFAILFPYFLMQDAKPREKSFVFLPLFFLPNLIPKCIVFFVRRKNAFPMNEKDARQKNMSRKWLNNQFSIYSTPIKTNI